MLGKRTPLNSRQCLPRPTIKRFNSLISPWIGRSELPCVEALGQRSFEIPIDPRITREHQQIDAGVARTITEKCARNLPLTSTRLSWKHSKLPCYRTNRRCCSSYTPRCSPGHKTFPGQPVDKPTGRVSQCRPSPRSHRHNQANQTAFLVLWRRAVTCAGDVPIPVAFLVGRGCIPVDVGVVGVRLAGLSRGTLERRLETLRRDGDGFRQNDCRRKTTDDCLAGYDAPQRTNSTPHLPIDTIPGPCETLEGQGRK
jgi:hypothetical protein